MSNDLAAIATIKAQTLARMAEVTSERKPSYAIDGQSVSWEGYLARLQATVDWCDRKLAGYEPFEHRSQGVS